MLTYEQRLLFKFQRDRLPSADKMRASSDEKDEKDVIDSRKQLSNLIQESNFRSDLDKKLAVGLFEREEIKPFTYLMPQTESHSS